MTKLLIACLTAALIWLPVTPATAASEAQVLGMMKAPVVGDPTLASLIGRWRGAGKFQRASNGAAEATQCRFTNTWTAGKRLARLLLACRGTELRFTADGYVGREGTTYRGAWSTTTGRNVVMAGRRSGSTLSLSVTQAGGQRESGNLTFRISGRTVIARFTARDSKTGRTYTAFETTLKR